MEQKVKELVREQIKKSQEKLKAAKSLLRNEFFDDAISRAYYAIFHAASAVLLTEGLTTESHSGLKTIFGLKFIKPGRIEKRYSRILSRLKDEMENGDYEIFTDFDFEDAEEAVKEAEEFVAEMKRFLKEILN